MARVWEENFAIRILSVGSVGFTDVADTSIPIDCNTVVVLNPSATVSLSLRSDPGNANSEVEIGPGQQFEIGGASGAPVAVEFKPAQPAVGDNHQPVDLKPAAPAPAVDPAKSTVQ